MDNSIQDTVILDDAPGAPRGFEMTEEGNVLTVHVHDHRQAMLEAAAESIANRVYEQGSELTQVVLDFNDVPGSDFASRDLYGMLENRLRTQDMEHVTIVGAAPFVTAENEGDDVSEITGSVRGELGASGASLE